MKGGGGRERETHTKLGPGTKDHYDHFLLPLFKGYAKTMRNWDAVLYLRLCKLMALVLAGC